MAMKQPTADAELLEAFVSFGGGEDGSGTIPVAVLHTTVSNFGLTLNVDDLAREKLGQNCGAGVDYEQFALMFRDIFTSNE